MILYSWKWFLFWEMWSDFSIFILDSIQQQWEKCDINYLQILNKKKKTTWTTYESLTLIRLRVKRCSVLVLWNSLRKDFLWLFTWFSQLEDFDNWVTIHCSQLFHCVCNFLKSIMYHFLYHNQIHIWLPLFSFINVA